MIWVEGRRKGEYKFPQGQSSGVYNRVVRRQKPLLSLTSLGLAHFPYPESCLGIELGDAKIFRYGLFGDWTKLKALEICVYNHQSNSDTFPWGWCLGHSGSGNVWNTSGLQN